MSLTPWIDTARALQINLVVSGDHRLVTVPTQHQVRMLRLDESMNFNASNVIRQLYVVMSASGSSPIKDSIVGRRVKQVNRCSRIIRNLWVAPLVFL